MKKISGRLMGEVFRLYLAGILFIEGIILLAIHLILKHYFNIDLTNGINIPMEYKKLFAMCLVISWIVIACKNYKVRRR